MKSPSRTSKNLKFWVTVSCLLAVTLFTGCASRAPKPVPNITQVMVLPVAPVDKLYTENKGVPIGILWQSLADRQKSTAFTENMEATRQSMAREFTSALLKELKARGFDAQLLEAVTRPAASPDDIDYNKLPTVHPVLHVYFQEVGMYSSRFSVNYIPRVNVSARLMRPGDEDYLYSDGIYYGADSRGDTASSIPADDRYKWASFNELIDQSSAVTNSYHAAVAAIAAKIATNLRTLSPVGQK